MRIPYLLFLGLVVLVTGCGSRANEETGRSFTDALGRTVQVREVRRVVSLAPSATEIVLAAGGRSQLVAVTTADDYPAFVRSLPKFSILPVAFEAVLAEKPDLIFLSEQISSPRDSDHFKALGLPSYFLGSSSLEEVKDAILAAGKIMGTDAVARRSVDSLNTRIGVLKASTDTMETRPSVLVLIGAQPLYAFGNESYIHELIALAGGRSLTERLTTAEPVLSDEFVLRAEPDVIICAYGNALDEAELLRLHPTWSGLKAFGSGRVYWIDPDLLLRPGPRLVAGAETMARQIHPSLSPTAGVTL